MSDLGDRRFSWRKCHCGRTFFGLWLQTRCVERGLAQRPRRRKQSLFQRPCRCRKPGSTGPRRATSFFENRGKACQRRGLIHRHYARFLQDDECLLDHRCGHADFGSRWCVGWVGRYGSGQFNLAVGHGRRRDPCRDRVVYARLGNQRSQQPLNEDAHTAHRVAA